MTAERTQAPAAIATAGGLSESREASTATRVIGAKALRRGLVVNVAGTVVPAVVAVFCIRDIVVQLGQEQFGLLAFAWIVINAIGILDLGIGRALTRFLAVRAIGDEEHEAAVVWTSLLALAGIGICGGAAAWALADPLAGSIARGSPALQAETATVVRILALSVPLVVLASGLRGVLEAFGRFDLTNRVSIPISLLNVLTPVVLLRLGTSLAAIVSALVFLRLGGTLLLGRFVLDVLPAMRTPRVRIDGIRPVLAFAGWATVSTIPGPLFAQAERYFVASFATLSAVAFYSTPADLLARVTVVPGAVLQVMFPVLSQAIPDAARATRLANRALVLIAAAVLPALTVLVAIAPEGLQLWLGPEFAAQGARAGRVLAIAVFVNCMAWLPFSLVQGAGRASWTGKLHAIEIPLYLVLGAFLIRAAGIDGAALANFLRSLVDALLIVWMATRVLQPRSGLGRHYLMVVVLGIVVLAGAAAPVSLALRLSWSVAAIAVASIVAWRRLLDAEARDWLSAHADAWGARIRRVGS